MRFILFFVRDTLNLHKLEYINWPLNKVSHSTVSGIPENPHNCLQATHKEHKNVFQVFFLLSKIYTEFAPWSFFLTDSQVYGWMLQQLYCIEAYAVKYNSGAFER